MTRSRLLFFVTVVLVFAAGIVLGRMSVVIPLRPAATTGPSPSWLADQLNLSADQRKRMDAIWSDVKQQRGNQFESRRALDHQRDQAIRQLLSDTQQTAYDMILSDYRARRQQADREMEKLIHDAEDRSRALLDDSQKKIWDRMTREMREHEHEHEHGPRWPSSPRGPTTWPATPPAPAPATAR
jgi:uncharacterized membrane protein